MKKHFPKKRVLLECIIQDEDLNYEEITKCFCPRCSETLLLAEPCEKRYGYRCPICKVGFKHYMDRGQYRDYIVMFSKIYDEDNKIRWSICLSEWSFLGRDKPIYKKFYYKLVYNKESKQLYIFTKTPKGKKTKVSPISNGAIAKWVNRDHFDTILKDKNYKHYMNRLKKELPNWMQNKEIDFYNFVSLIRYPVLMNLPHLSHFPLGRCTRLISPVVKNKLLKCEESIYSLFQELHGFKPTKSEIKIITENSLNLVMYPILKRIIKDNNHVVNVLKSMSEWKNTDCFSLSQFYFKYFLNPKCRMKECNLLINLQVIRGLYDSETAFVRAMINTIHGVRSYERLEMYILHSVMYLTEHEFEDNHGIFRNARDFQTIHDSLMRMDSYLHLCGKKFHYSEDEILKFEKEMKGFKFILPKSGEDLYKVHCDLRLCVDLYAGYISNGRGYLIFLENVTKNKIEYCLEINNKNQLRQAKAFCNQYPSSNVANIIAEYCKGIRVSIATNDLSSYESLSVS
ncbi:hypothetical protein BTT_63540 (plasmid) [Bacillus thuringiensis serovar morrisoni str. 4AA1]|uniref:PcfJ domain-containing protein n=1 Tax=Bacillus TaxID=1386 RepID=UPI0005CED5C3|nr:MULTISPECIES: PcfJ domain-containing protein [Bacillus]AJQ62672.1 hypothetical protein SD98_30970 [Bacillus thuringiensis serovar morrisoni]MED3102657.1 PcfJ domain-containing protein [Bacillus thuringiensis]MRB00103.1 hypothetical protein [Bacillus thuringiensis]OTY27716.1 hypothetical protein BK736_31035 [Bacillus thuringiensis serovar poloniensis]RUR60288.1 hypothetical protein ELS81_27225 [Bacillus sp. VKPM B-3276]